MSHGSEDEIRFTPRELEIVLLVRAGKPNKLIAHALGIAESTVKVHIRNLMRKTRTTNRVQVANHAPAIVAQAAAA